MKRTLLSATALALILSVPAFAAPHDHGDHHDNGTPAAAATPAAPAPGAVGHGHGHAHGTGGANPFAGGANGSATGGTHHRGGGTANTPAAGGNATTNNPFAGGGATGGRHGSNNTGTAVIFGTGGHGIHAGRGHNSAFDSLRLAFNAPRHFHGGNYHRPRGWYAHRWTFGEFLPALFYSRSYWISDYSDFDLSDPPPGTVWVRYGDDALLIDEDSGEVIEVVYGIFY